MLTISKIILHNFKRFKDLTLNVNSDINIYIGDNESGKSTILQAIDLVSRGSVTRIENIGLNRLFNIEVINDFLDGNKDMTKLPEMYVELYFTEDTESILMGKNNSLRRNCSGIKLTCNPNDAYNKNIAQLLRNKNASFPLEFYKTEFSTFAGESYNGYTKILNSLFIDNSTIGSPYAMREYVNDIFHSQLSELERVNAKYAYKDSKIQFQSQVLAPYNESISPYCFAIKESVTNNIETYITILENNIPLDNKGTGCQCFIKTKLSLNKAVQKIDTVLIEEPENHLSYTKMLELIELIRKASNRQIFISTHCNLIATRLNLKKCLLFNSASTNVASLSNLPDDTANFFIKAPDNNMLQFVLSQKSILVEGDAEFILMEALYKNITDRELSESGIGLIAVDGKCFKRYLDIAKILKNKVAVITDNDGDYDENINNNYSDYINNQFDNIKIFSDKDNSRHTFEVCIYNDNQETCEQEFDTPKRRLTILDYMLKNKTEAAYKLLTKKADTLIVPEYIKDAITWIED